MTVGRTLELAAVERFLDGVSDGPAALLVEGVAGIGKTTLWRAAIDAARARGFTILSTTAVDSETDLPFVGLRDLSATVPVEAADELPDVQHEALDRALLRSAGSADPHAVCAAALSVVQGMSRDRPIVVAVDDVPWLDRPSQRLLSYVVRRLRRERVGMLIARRSGEARLPIGLDGTVPVERVELGELDPDALHALLTDHGMALSRRTTAHIHRVSGGNPFYAVEIGRAVVRDGGRVTGELPVPGGVLAVTAERLAALSPTARHALDVVALLADPSVERVAEIVGPDAAGALEEAAAEGLLDIDGDGLRFTHPILRSAVTAALPAARARTLHRDIAASSITAGERALHVAAAATGPDAAAATALDGAARRASAQGAPDAAADLADRAVALTPPDHREQRARRVIDAATYHYRADDAATARERLRPVIDELPPGPLRAEALLWSGTCWSEDDTDTALAHLRSALADVTDGGAARDDTGRRPGTDPGRAQPGGELSAAAHRQLAVVQVFAGDSFTADAHARRALLAATAGGDPASIAESRATLAWTQFWNGHGVRSELLAGGRGPWSRFAPNHKSLGIVTGMLLSLTDDLDAARATLLAEYRDARERGMDRAACIALFNLIEVERRAGHWDLCLEYAAEGHRIADVAGDGLGRALLLQARGHIHARQGKLDDARADAAAATALGEAISSPMVLRFAASLSGFVALSAGDHAAADRYLSPLAEGVLRDRGFDPGLARFVADHVEALVSLGELDRAEQLLAPFAAQAVAVGRASAIASAARSRALVLAARGDAEDALAALDAALLTEQPFERGRTLLVAGSIHRRARRRKAARDALLDAVAIFERLGSPLWAERAREETARIGGRAPTSTALTEAEERVAALVSAGRSNREVAAELFLSVGTVESVLWKVYRKLGIRSRTELAVARQERERD